MSRDRYLEIFALLDSYVSERSLNESFIELGGIVRNLPSLDDAIIESCHISHYLSNDLEQKWIRALHLALTSSLTATAVHERFRSMVGEDLAITFAGQEETKLCTKYSREVITAQAFDGADSTKVFLSSQLLGFDESEALSFLFNPLGELTPDNSLAIRLVSVRSSRTIAEGQPKERMLEQRWVTTDVESAMRSIVEAVDGDHWVVEQNLRETKTGSTAILKHIPSADRICLNAVMGYGQLELQARRQSTILNN